MSLLVLCATVYFMLTTAYFQTKISHAVAAYLSNKLQVPVSVEGVDVALFDKLVLEGVYIADKHQDTLLYIGRLKVSVIDLQLKRSLLQVNSLALSDGKFFLKQYKAEKDLNLQFLIDALSSSDTTSSKPFRIKCKHLQLSNMAFAYHDFNEQPIQKGMDYFNLLVTQINGSFTDVSMHRDTIEGNIEQFDCLDRCGFRLKRFSCHAEVCSKSVRLKGLWVQTDYSLLLGDYAMLYEHYPDFLEYITNVRMESHIKKGFVSMKDIAFFAEPLWGMDQQVMVSGDFNGTVDNFKATHAVIEAFSKTRLSGDFKITGLPDIDNTFLDLKIASLQTNKRSIEEIPLPDRAWMDRLQLPSNINELGMIRFNGRFTGFLTDFVTYGTFTTNLGVLQTDINLKYDVKSHQTQYSGKLSSPSFGLGHFLGSDKYLGNIAFTTDIQGKGLARSEVNAKVDGAISEINFNGYAYHDLLVSGAIAQGLFEGHLKVNDANLALDFNGTIDLSQKEPIFDFNADIKKANLHTIHFINRDPSATLSTELSSHFSGDRIDDLVGTISLNNINYTEASHSYSYKRVELMASRTNDQHVLQLRSDLADANLQGVFSVSNLPHAIQDMIARMLPSLKHTAEEEKVAEVHQKQQFTFDLKLKDTQAITTLFIPEIAAAPGSFVEGDFNAQASTFGLRIQAPHLSLYGFEFSNFKASGNAQDRVFNFHSESNKLGLNDALQAEQFDLEAKVAADTLGFRLRLANTDSSHHHADLNGIFVFQEHQLNLHISPSELVINDQPWLISDGNQFVLDSTSLRVDQFALRNGEQELRINGSLGMNEQTPMESNKLTADVTRFDLHSLDWILNPLGVNLGGAVNGSALLTGYIAKPGFSSNMAIHPFAFNGDTLGDAIIGSAYTFGQNFLSILTTIGKENVKTIQADGKYWMDKPGQELDLQVDFQKTYLQKFARYFNDFAKDLKGIASGSLHLGGSFSALEVTGSVFLQKTSFGVEYLNTAYNFSDTIKFSKNAILFNKIKLNDKFGNTALVSGSLKHHHFEDFVFDVTMEPTRFQCLNTGASMNSMYYGNAIASGLITVTGPLDTMVMNVNLHSEKGTKVYIPLANPEEVSQHNFISFVVHDTLSEKKGFYREELAGLQLNMELEVTPDAEVQIIFDSKIGDVIKGKGTGNLKMEVSPTGDFKMFGDYVIEEGEYLFTLQNILNKKFIIEKGGTVSWTGDPLDAEVNMDAVYKLRASLTNMLPDESELASVSKVRAVECKMRMTNKLMNPTINFDIQLPGLEIEDAHVSDRFKSYTTAVEEKTRQVMSLLVLRQFQRPPELADFGSAAGATGSVYGATTTEFLSNQLNNWVSQVSNKFDLGVKVGEEQVGASFGKRFFNDRVIVDGSVSYNNQNSMATSNALVGDVNVEAKLNKSGKWRAKYFYKSNSAAITENDNSRQGAGLVYKTEFDNLQELRVRNRLQKMTRKLLKGNKIAPSEGEAPLPKE